MWGRMTSLAAALGGLTLVAPLAVLPTAGHGQETQSPPAPAGPPPATAELTLDQARGLARHAFRSGNYRLANELAHGLLQANPDDVSALILLAATEPFLGRPAAGRKAGARAWRLPEGRNLRHEIAFYTARAALREERFELTKLWLRRAYDTADGEVAQNRLARDFQQVRAISPWSGSLSLNLAPSSNLNGGSTWDWLLIDDRFVVGEMNGASQALPGWRATMRGAVSYKFRQSATGVTSLGFDLSHQAAFLSDEAKRMVTEVDPNDATALVQTVRNSDLASSTARLSLTQIRRRGEAGVLDSARLSLGQHWVGHDPSARFLALDLGRSFPIGADGRNSLSFQAGAQREWSATGAADRDLAFLRGSWHHVMEGGSSLRLSFSRESVRSDGVNQDYGQWNIGASWSAAEPLGPARLSLHLGWRERDYASYRVGPFAAPNGRHDDEWSATVSFNFDQFDYMGFSPVLSLTASETKSNITRFETRASGLSLGFQSRF